LLSPFVSPGKALVQLVGFAVGAALLWWLVKGALDTARDPSRTGIIESVQLAWSQRPWLVIGIVLTTVASLVIDGALFWLVLLPVRRLKFMEMQWLTLVASLSNFFPVRLGIAVRYTYHLRANRLTFLQCTAWFIAVTLVILASLVAVVAATMVDSHPDVLWAVTALAALAVSGLALRWVVTLPVIRRRMGGWDRMLTVQSTYWAGALLRVIEVLLWIVRMWCAAEILNLGLSFATVTILGVAAIAVMLNPLGRLGFREATTVIVASWLSGQGTDLAHLDGGYKQLALLESFGEMLTTIPLGLVALPMIVKWYRRRRAESPSVAGGERST
jgi:hypothetical protein